MNQERPPQPDKALPDRENNREFSSQNLAINNSSSFLDLESESFSTADLDSELQPIFLPRSHFSQGVFWGAIFSFTALFSASCGVALSKIAPVERAIAQKFNLSSSSEVTPQEQPSLIRPIDLLLLEVEPSEDAESTFDRNFTGESKTILLLRFQPEAGVVRVVNIPPNSRVKIPGFGWGTIADANRYGGTALVSRMVAQLMDDIQIDRHVRATPDTFGKLIASGKITPHDCVLDLSQCSNPKQQVSRQKKSVETIRQRLNIPTYLRTFKLTLTKIKPNLDTNLSIPEALLLADFFIELDSDKISVNLVGGYVAGQTINISDRLSKSELPQSELPQSDLPQTIAPKSSQLYSDRDFSFHHRPIAVQNTTDSPELGMRFVSYLRSQNFQDVYLVEHIPLRLNKTQIIIDPSQLARAKHLQKTIGFGSLQPKPEAQSQPLTIQIGEDADRLPITNNY